MTNRLPLGTKPLLHVAVQAELATLSVQLLKALLTGAVGLPAQPAHNNSHGTCEFSLQQGGGYVLRPTASKHSAMLKL